MKTVSNVASHSINSVKYQFLVKNEMTLNDV